MDKKNDLKSLENMIFALEQLALGLHEFRENVFNQFDFFDKRLMEIVAAFKKQFPYDSKK